MTCRRSLFPVAAVLGIFVPAGAFAQRPNQDQLPVAAVTAAGPFDDTALTAVVGLAVAPSYEGSDNTNVIPLVAVTGEINGYAFSILETSAQIDLVRNRPGPGWDIQFGPAIEINLNRTSGIGDSRVSALGARRAAIEVGAQLGVARNGVLNKYDTLSLGASIVGDVANVHGAVIAEPNLSYSTPLSRRIYVSFEAAASHVGDGYARTYFDVDATKASRSSLPRFSARGGWMSWSLGADVLYALSRSGLGRGWGLAANVSYSRLLGDFARSPVTAIAGSRHQFAAGMGVAYSF